MMDTFDRWHYKKHGAYFDAKWQAHGQPIDVSMRVLSQELRDYVTEAVNQPEKNAVPAVCNPAHNERGRLEVEVEKILWDAYKYKYSRRETTYAILKLFTIEDEK